MRPKTLSLAVLSLWMMSEATAYAAPPPPTGQPPRSVLQGGGGAGTDDPTVGSRELEEDHTGAWSYSTGKEEGPNYVRPAEEAAAELKINPIGYYQGVSVAGENLPPFAPAAPGMPPMPQFR